MNQGKQSDEAPSDQHVVEMHFKYARLFKKRQLTNNACVVCETFVESANCIRYQRFGRKSLYWDDIYVCDGCLQKCIEKLGSRIKHYPSIYLEKNYELRGQYDNLSEDLKPFIEKV